MTDAFSTAPRDDANGAAGYEPGEVRPTSSATPADNGFQVALTLELETLHIPLQRLQALREGAVLPLDAAEGPIQVRVIAGGRAIARGTLVNVGAGYGVLVGPEEA